MNVPFYCAAVAAAVLALAGSASADDSMMSKPGAMTAQPSATMATMLCRPAMANEKPTALMGTSALVCKHVDTAAMDSMKKSLMSMPGGEPLYLKMFQEYHIEANGV